MILLYICLPFAGQLDGTLVMIFSYYSCVMLSTTDSRNMQERKTEHCVVVGNKRVCIRQLHGICVTLNIKAANLYLVFRFRKFHATVTKVFMFSFIIIVTTMIFIVNIINVLAIASILIVTLISLPPQEVQNFRHFYLQPLPNHVAVRRRRRCGRLSSAQAVTDCRLFCVALY